MRKMPRIAGIIVSMVLGLSLPWLVLAVVNAQPVEQPKPSSTPISIKSRRFVQVCFTPEGQCDKKIQAILDSYLKDGKKHNLRVSSYFLTNSLFSGLFEQFAQNKENTVRVIVDMSCTEVSKSCKHMSIPAAQVKVADIRGGIDHNKVIIIDDDLVITGSANLTFQAFKKNKENVLVLRDKEIINAYIKDFDDRWDSYK